MQLLDGGFEDSGHLAALLVEVGGKLTACLAEEAQDFTGYGVAEFLIFYFHYIVVYLPYPVALLPLDHIQQTLLRSPLYQ